MRPIRIALVTRRFPPLIGGAERVLAYLAEALAEAGAEVTVLTSRLGGLPAEGQVGGARVVRLETSTLRFLGTLRYMAGLRRRLRAHPVDLAYVSMLKHDAHAVVGVGRSLGFPVVLRPEGAGATGDVAWQAWGRGGRSIARRCRKADAFVAISPAVRAELVGAGYPGPRVVDLPNGVPIPDRPWRPRPGWSRAPRAAFVGRLAAEKGLRSLIAAWPIVRETFPEATLVLVGDGPERPAIEAEVARLDLDRSIFLPGATARPGAILRGSDLFVLPSREEGMSLALLEAMALGIPLVASAIPGNLALIDDGTHGATAPPDDPVSLARAIVARWSGFDASVAQGLAARSRVLDRYSIAAVARVHLDLFRELIGRRGHPLG